MIDHSPGCPSKSNQCARFVLTSVDDMRAQVDPAADWLWDGYLRRGCVTLLVSQWKSGKTTLVAALLSRLRAGGLFLGQTLQRGKAAVISEESRQQFWQYAGRRRVEVGIEIAAGLARLSW